MFVKICGITNREDALAAVDNGAGALGFIFHRPSPRYVNPDSLLSWMDEVPAGVWRVGVFVDRPAEEIRRVCRHLKLDVAQLHGSESAMDFPAGVLEGIRVWQAFRVDQELPAAVDEYAVEAVLLDGLSSGQSFNWKLARNVIKPVIVAGGLNERNISEAMEQARPWGVDVSSSLELYPGKKDHARMARFLKACHPVLSNHY